MMTQESHKNNTILEFHKYVEDGKLMVCEEIKQAMALDLKKLEIFDYHEKETQDCINWIEKWCVLPIGTNKGQPIKLTIIQKWIIANMLGFYGEFDEEYKDPETGEDKVKITYQRVTREVLILVGSGFGKSVFTSALLSYMFFSGKFVDPQMYLGGTSYSISKRLLEKVESMIRAKSQLNQLVTIKGNPTPGIEFKKNTGYDGKIQAMSSDGKNQEGIEPFLILLDEIHTMGLNGYADSLKKNATKRLDMLAIEITTEGTVREGYLDLTKAYYKKVLSQEVEEYRKVAFIFKQDSVKEIFEAYRDENYRVWEKSNPHMGLVNSAGAIKDIVKKMVDDTTTRTQALTKNFNMPQTDGDIWLSNSEEIEGKEFDENIFRNNVGFIGIDHAWTTSPDTDWTVIDFMVWNPLTEDTYHKKVFLMPEHYVHKKLGVKPLFPEKVIMDGKNLGYMRHLINEEIILLPDIYKITWKEILDVILAFMKEYTFLPLKVGYDDGTDIQQLAVALNDLKSDNMFCLPVKMSERALNEPRLQYMKSLRGNGKYYCNSKLDRTHASNTVLSFDKYDKPRLETSKRKHRNDSIVAELCAHRALNVWKQQKNTDNTKMLSNRYKSYGVLEKLEEAQNNMQILSLLGTEYNKDKVEEYTTLIKEYSREEDAPNGEE